MSQKFKGNIQVEGNLKLPNVTSGKALVLDGSGNLTNSTTDASKIDYLSGVTSDVQTQLNNKIETSELGVTVATLDGGGKIPVSQLPNSIMEFKGLFDPATATFTDGTGNTGDVYMATAAGSYDAGSGSITYNINDFAVHDGSAFRYSPNSNAVVSVNGAQGIVVLDADDVGAANKTLSNLTGPTAINQSLIFAGGNTIETPVDSAGSLELKTGNHSTSSSGSVYLTTGNADIHSGSVIVTTGTATNGIRGDLVISARQVDVSNSEIKNVADPVLAQDAATKNYVDTNAYSDEQAQDTIGNILTDSASIDFTYNDGTPSITASVLPAGVDHNQLQNFDANKHIDHSFVAISTLADSGLTGGGDLTVVRQLSVDINGTTAETVAADADKLLIYDASATALKSMTRSNFLSGTAKASSGDIQETSFAGAEGQTAQNVTGFAFANGTVRSFSAHVSITVNATTSLYETYDIYGIQKSGSWEISQVATGDDSLVTFTIDNTGQIKYTSSTYAGFSALTIKFRAITTSV